jgi:hypothetical protein
MSPKHSIDRRSRVAARCVDPHPIACCNHAVGQAGSANNATTRNLNSIFTCLGVVAQASSTNRAAIILGCSIHKSLLLPLQTNSEAIASVCRNFSRTLALSNF